jgi:hypothetical protein
MIAFFLAGVAVMKGRKRSMNRQHCQKNLLSKTRYECAKRQTFRKMNCRDLCHGQQEVANTEPGGERAQGQRDPERETIKSAIIFAVEHDVFFLSELNTFVVAIWLQQTSSFCIAPAMPTWRQPAKP